MYVTGTLCAGVWTINGHDARAIRSNRPDDESKSCPSSRDPPLPSLVTEKLSCPLAIVINFLLRGRIDILYLSELYIAMKKKKKKNESFANTRGQRAVYEGTRRVISRTSARVECHLMLSRAVIYIYIGFSGYPD